MKILLACSMCLVLAASECLAISGGPVFGSGLNVVGTYAGVIKARRADAPPSGQFPPDTPPGCSLNSLGVFSVGVPTSGISTGSFVMFSQGRVFTGTIRGTADPGTAKLTGVLNATFDFSVTRTFINPTTGEVTTTTTQVTAEANGHLKTTISSGSAQAGTSATRLAGTATLTINQGQVNGADEPIPTCEMTLKVNGFKQSNTATTSTGTTG
jgi:hypothetical protein